MLIKQLDKYNIEDNQNYTDGNRKYWSGFFKINRFNPLKKPPHNFLNN